MLSEIPYGYQPLTKVIEPEGEDSLESTNDNTPVTPQFPLQRQQIRIPTTTIPQFPIQRQQMRIPTTMGGFSSIPISPGPTY